MKFEQELRGETSLCSRPQPQFLKLSMTENAALFIYISIGTFSFLKNFIESLKGEHIFLVFENI